MNGCLSLDSNLQEAKKVGEERFEKVEALARAAKKWAMAQWIADGGEGLLVFQLLLVLGLPKFEIYMIGRGRQASVCSLLEDYRR